MEGKSEVRLNIVFICGGLEPGRDGVGDYTLNLAKELKENGHKVSILALNDWYVNEPLESKFGPVLDHIKVLRLPSKCSEKHRFSAAKNWIEMLNPDWLSLQFVPFSFQRKGLPFRLKHLLGRLSMGRRLHIMFHELWVGMPIEASKKHRFWGWLQQRIIRLLVDDLKPAVIHTQCRLYLNQLSRLGFRVSHLPLFSNIPVYSLPIGNKLESCQDSKMPDDNVFLIMFGTIHPLVYMTQFIDYVLAYKQQHSVQFQLILAGKCGSQQDRWIAASQAAGIDVLVLGECTEAEISVALSSATIGVSTSALPMIDKSGTVAAMLDHKLPVLCIGHNWTARGVGNPVQPGGIYVLEQECIAACLSGKSQISKPLSIAEAAKQFVNELVTSN